MANNMFSLCFERVSMMEYIFSYVLKTVRILNKTC